METYDPFNTLTLSFVGTRYPKAIVRCRLDMSYDEYEATRAALFPAGGLADAKTQYEVFGDKVLIEWNLVDPKSKKTIPPTKAGVLLAPPPLVRYAIDAWAAAFWNVSAPLDDGSTPG